VRSHGVELGSAPQRSAWHAPGGQAGTICTTESSAGTLAHEGAVAQDVGYAPSRRPLLHTTCAAVNPYGRFPSHAESQGDKNHRQEAKKKGEGSPAGVREEEINGLLRVPLTGRKSNPPKARPGVGLEGTPSREGI